MTPSGRPEIGRPPLNPSRAPVAPDAPQQDAIKEDS